MRNLFTLSSFTKIGNEVIFLSISFLLLFMKYLFAILCLAIFSNCQTNEPTKNEGEQKSEKKELKIDQAQQIQPPSNLIRLNQLGYFSNAQKIASVVGDNKLSSFSIIDTKTSKEVFTGSVAPPKQAKLSGETIQQFDFSEFKQAGTYQIKLENGLYSYPFEIGKGFYDEVLITATKSYYYQRISSAITEKHGGKWNRPAGHPDKEVFYHPSTGKTGAISSPKGWYDAGDFGKYVTNGSFSASQLLHSIESYPQLYADGALNIPESGNGINDLLDEVKYEADWVATMQDEDGGVFHKLTTKRFTDAIMPDKGDQPRFIMAKSSVATFDFAAFLAKMARHYKKHNANQADEWLEQAKKAWSWGIQNPNVAFKNASDVVTGEYGDNDATQEQFWAATELYVATNEQQYLDFIIKNLPDLTYTYGDGWKSFMRYLGVFTLLKDDVKIPDDLKQELEKRLIASADDLTNRVQTFDYQQGVNDFQWASNSDDQNVAFVIANAHKVAPKPEYVTAVLSSLNYLFGHNALGLSMITGIGDHSPMNVHHRQSKADGIKDPVPGFVCGGPNNHKQDVKEVKYPKGVSPMQSYQDVWESYASNEVCLNWNAPTPYILQFAIEQGK